MTTRKFEDIIPLFIKGLTGTSPSFLPRLFLVIDTLQEHSSALCELQTDTSLSNPTEFLLGHYNLHLYHSIIPQFVVLLAHVNSFFYDTIRKIEEVHLNLVNIKHNKLKATLGILIKTFEKQIKQQEQRIGKISRDFKTNRNMREIESQRLDLYKRLLDSARELAIENDYDLDDLSKIANTRNEELYKMDDRKEEYNLLYKLSSFVLHGSSILNQQGIEHTVDYSNVNIVYDIFDSPNNKYIDMMIILKSWCSVIIDSYIILDTLEYHNKANKLLHYCQDEFKELDILIREKQ